MNLSISYQSLTLPPPYAFGYTLELSLNQDSLSVDFQLEYLDREDVDIEEIEAEGFTSDDNFSWQGTLGDAWVKTVQSKLKTLVLEERSADEDHWLFMKNDNRQGHPHDAEEWLYLLQELMQAIYEKAGRERQLEVAIRHVESAENAESFLVVASFEKRQASINEKPIDWEYLKDLMTLLYNQEYAEETTKKTKQKGLWLDFSNEGYFQEMRGKGKKKEEALQAIIGRLRG